MLFILSLVLGLSVAQNAVQIQNGIDAKRLDDAKSSNLQGADCTGSDVVCLGDAIGQCVNNKLVKVSDCAGGLTCHVLPLVNKPGTSVSCDTESDKQARFAAAGVNNASPILPPNTSTTDETSLAATNEAPVAPVEPQTAPAASSNKAGDFECIDDTQFKHFVSADRFVIESCPPGFCATRNPPSKNPCIGKANADRIDKKE